MAASGAISGYGTLIGLSDGGSPAVYTPIAEVVSIGGGGGKRTMIDVTHLASADQCREFIGGLVERGEIDLGINFIPTDATNLDLITNLQLTDPSTCFRTWRIVFPDFVTGTTATVSTTTVTAGAVNTVEPVRFTTSGTLPTPIKAGRVYFAKRLSPTTFSIHTSAADALAGTDAISGSGGSGTHTAWTGTRFTFSAATQELLPSQPQDDKISAQVKLKITGNVSITPA